MFAVLHIPDFSLQAVLRHEPELKASPVALVGEDSARSKIAQVTAAARTHGVAPGLTSTQAKARCEHLRFRLRSVPQEEAAQEILLESAYASAAFLESTGTGLCTADLRGLPLLRAEPLGPALEQWADQLRKRLQTFELEATVGIAAAPGLALQAALTATPFLWVTEPESFWNGLPVDRLTTNHALLQILSKWGTHTARQFLALGKDRIAERLGIAGIELYEEIKADEPRPLRLTSPRQIYQEFFQFEHLVETLEPLLFTVRRLLGQLLARLWLAFLSVAELEVRLQLESGQVHSSIVKVAAPTHDLEALFRITHNYLETVRTPSPIAAVSLRATPTQVKEEQFQLFETSVRDPNRFFETISRLNALLGADRVGTPKLGNSFRPDDFELVPPESAPKQKEPLASSLLPPLSSPPPLRGLALRRYRPALPAVVRLRNGSPTFVDSAGPTGSIVASHGPWRRSGNWWESLWSREEWDVQTKDGALYRVFLENNQWFVEGSYD